MTTHGDMVMQFGGMPVGEIVQGNSYFVDNRKSSASDSNTGRNWKEPKLTIQSAIDEAPANSGSRVYVMGSGIRGSFNSVDITGESAANLYGVYQENIHLDATDYGMQLIGINRPFITGNAPDAENVYGYTPTIQIGSYGVSSKGPKFCRIAGFHIGGWGDDADDTMDHFRYGVGISIGDYWDASYNDDCYEHLIENCTFRATNANSAAQTNDEDVHTWIKGWGNEKVTVRHCSFFQGQYGIGMMASENNQPMEWLLEDCQFWYTTTACLHSSGTPYWCRANRCLFSPATAEQEFDITGGLGSHIVDCDFPMCNEALNASLGVVNAPNLGTFTGWAVSNGKGQAGPIYKLGT